MKQPHIHAALIHAWADGAQIQYSSNGGETWVDCNITPRWAEDILYRIAPITIKYRKYLCNNGLGSTRVAIYHYDSDKSIRDCEKNIFFIKWVDTEWQELEITE